MHDQHRINVKSITDIPLCQQMLTDYLAFHQVNVTALNPLFKGSLCVDTFTSLPFIQAVKLDMFTHISHFVHADCDQHCQQHCILIHSLSSLIVNAKKKDIHLPSGGYMLIPAWEPFTLKSQSHHYGLIFNLDIHEAGLKLQPLAALFWKVGNHLRYGNVVNNLLCDYYAPLNDACYKQLLNSIKTLLVLQSEQVACSCNFNKTNFIPNFDICAIAHLIRQNMTNPHYSINELADHYGMSVRLLQYKLARYQLSFSELLPMIIRNMPDANRDTLVRSCGFTNLRMANRQFKKLRNQTVMQFQAQEQGHFRHTQLNSMGRIK